MKMLIIIFMSFIFIGCDVKVFPDPPSTCVPIKENYSGGTAICSVNGPTTKERCEENGTKKHYDVSGLDGLLLCETAGFYFPEHERKKAIDGKVVSSFRNNWED